MHAFEPDRCIEFGGKRLRIGIAVENEKGYLVATTCERVRVADTYPLRAADSQFIDEKCELVPYIIC